MKKTFLLGVVICVAILNFYLMFNEESLLIDFRLASVEYEAKANREESTGVEQGVLRKYACGIDERVIVGYNSDGTPIFAMVGVQGEKGICEGPGGTCNPYDCTKVLW